MGQENNEVTLDEVNPQPETAAESAPPTPEDELSKALAQMEEYKDALLRERADFQNFRKRVEREKETQRTTLTGDVISRFLPVVDDFDRAVNAVPTEEKDKDWIVGVIQIQRKLLRLLETEGVQVIDPLGQPFDPNRHEAIGADDASPDYPSGHVTVVLQKGYLKDERVLRAAVVRVAN